MFCDCFNDPNETRPNFNVCPICMAHPGTLPVINGEAIKKLIGVGLALNCRILNHSKFDRKNYFYPDLPKGYQISQFDLPLCREGELKIGPASKSVQIERIHMEEDTGRLLHGADGYSLVDYNRAGIPLMELVTHPDLSEGSEVEAFARELQLILRYLGASEADMEKGQMRVEVNISVRRKSEDGAEVPLGTKVEVKNINSINAAARAADYEIKRQIAALENGEKIIQETRGWDDGRQETVSQRIKEGSSDYRYFPEPDLPPLRLEESYIDTIRKNLPELPEQRRVRLIGQYGILRPQADIFTASRYLGDYFEEVISELLSWDNLKHLKRPEKEHEQDLIRSAANYIITELPPLWPMADENANLSGFKITPENFAELVVKLFHKELSSTAAKAVLKVMATSGEDPDDVMQRLDLGQISDAAAIGDAVDDAIAKNAKAAEDYKKGKTEVIKFLVGQVMMITRGKANPEVALELLKQKLGSN